MQIFAFNRRAAAAEETAKAMQKTAELTERGNIAERFKNAIEHLGNDSASVRLGGAFMRCTTSHRKWKGTGNGYLKFCVLISGKQQHRWNIDREMQTVQK